jgi:hypothetical protein
MSDEIAKREDPTRKTKYTLHFEEEMKRLEEEIGEIDGLYDDIRDQIKNVMAGASRNRGNASPLTFVSNMFENALSAKSSKISLLKELVHVKKYIADLDLKEEKGGEDEERFKALAREFYKMVSDESEGSDFAEELDAETSIGDDDLDSVALLAYEKETGKSFSLESEEEEEEEGEEEPTAPPGLRPVVDQDGVVWLMDDDYNLVEEATDQDSYGVEVTEDGVTATDPETGEQIEYVETE